MATFNAVEVVPPVVLVTQADPPAPQTAQVVKPRYYIVYRVG